MTCPCNKCPKKGCGRQAACKDYMDFWQSNRRENDRRLKASKLNAYVAEAIRQVKDGRHGSWKAYRNIEETPSK